MEAGILEPELVKVHSILKKEKKEIGIISYVHFINEKLSRVK